MNFKPILYQPEMIQAKKAKRKTQTRRDVGLKKVNEDPNGWHLSEIWNKGGDWYARFIADRDGAYLDVKSRYGGPGDILWNRESFNCYYSGEDLQYAYKADGDPEFPFKGWKPSIHMPKEAARLFDRVVNIRIERLSHITEDDAAAEGLAKITKDGGRTWKYGIPDIDGYPGTDDYGWPWDEWEISAVAAYRKLWVKINGQESLLKDPWLWVITFEPIDKPENFPNQ